MEREIFRTFEHFLTRKSIVRCEDRQILGESAGQGVTLIAQRDGNKILHHI